MLILLNFDSCYKRLFWFVDMLMIYLLVFGEKVYLTSVVLVDIRVIGAGSDTG